VWLCSRSTLRISCHELWGISFHCRLFVNSCIRLHKKSFSIHKMTIPAQLQTFDSPKISALLRFLKWIQLEFNRQSAHKKNYNYHVAAGITSLDNMERIQYQIIYHNLLISASIFYISGIKISYKPIRISLFRTNLCWIQQTNHDQKSVTTATWLSTSLRRRWFTWLT
jgi:hypothetical protein